MGTLWRSRRAPYDKLVLRPLVFLIVAPGWLPAEEGCARLLEAKLSTYAFSPSSLSKLEKSAKIRALDRFWQLAKEDPKQSASCLSAMLQREEKGSFFLFDGSQLLLSLDNSAYSADIIAQALANADLNDFKPYDYVALSIEAAKAGANISNAAMNFVRARHVEEYEPGVGVLMNRERGAVALFDRMPVEEVLEKGKALYRSGDPAATPYGLLILALAMTPDALAFVKEVGDLAGLPAHIRRQISPLLSPNRPPQRYESVYNREQLRGILKSAPNYPDRSQGPSLNEDFLMSAFVELKAEDAPLVREARRQSMGDLSARSLLEYYAYTRILQAVQTKAGIFGSGSFASAAPSPIVNPAPKKKMNRAKRKSKARLR